MAAKKKKPIFWPVVVFVCIATASALLSGYLTFKVQFERRKSPVVKREKQMSYQLFRIKEQERMQSRKHFHRLTEDINLKAWGNKSSCIICHSPYPHGRNLQAIAVMNLHTEFMTCTSCHLKIDKKQDVRFGWINPEGKESKAEPYGVRIDAETGAFAETENHFSKLTPFLRTAKGLEPIVSTAQASQALQYMEEKESYSEEKKKEIVDRLHQGTELKEFVICADCHSKNGLMDFKQLGFHPSRINQLEKMEISGMLTNYDTFYFPDFFKEKLR